MAKKVGIRKMYAPDDEDRAVPTRVAK